MSKEKLFTNLTRNSTHMERRSNKWGVNFMSFAIAKTAAGKMKRQVWPLSHFFLFASCDLPERQFNDLSSSQQGGYFSPLFLVTTLLSQILKRPYELTQRPTRVFNLAS